MTSTISRRKLFRILGTEAALFGLGATNAIAASSRESSSKAHSTAVTSAQPGRGVVADPTRLPSPIKRQHSVHHEVTLEAREVAAEIEPGVKFNYMTYDGQVPGPMIRVRQGDTVALTLRNNSHSITWHSIDLHAVYGPGDAAEALTFFPASRRRPPLRRCIQAPLSTTAPCPTWTFTWRGECLG